MRPLHRFLLAAALSGAAASLCAATVSPTPSVTQTAAFSDTPSATETEPPTAGPTATDTPAPPSGSATGTPTPAPPITPTSTPPATAAPTASVTPTPTGAPAPAFSATATPALSPTATPGPDDPGGRTYAYPNPAPDDTVNVVFGMDGPGEARLRVFQSAGEPAAEIRERYASGGVKVLAVPLRGFARGVFIYKVDLKYDDGRRDRRPLGKFVRSQR